MQKLKYHPPGLAPYNKNEEAYHVDRQRNPVYEKRFKKVFGYYDQLAAVIDNDGWYHIDTKGKPAYEQCYHWCGNFQNGACTVKDANNHYYHINKMGQRLYCENYAYAGDFRDDVACVQNEDGYYTHINIDGKLLHGQWFHDLDIFHKGFARAKDQNGWFHINEFGKHLYPQRYSMIEPFYNGFARVETQANELQIIDENGQTVQIIKPKTNNDLHQLSAELVSFWKTQTIYAAVKLKVFEQLPGNLKKISLNTNIQSRKCKRLLLALADLNLVSYGHETWHATDKGQLLTQNNKTSLAPATLTWGHDHYLRWHNLLESLLETDHQTADYFASISNKQDQLATYHNALSAYAKHDYQKITEHINWEQHNIVIDAGGGTGTLLKLVTHKHQHLKAHLLERPEVINLIKDSNTNFQQHPMNFFSNWTISADAILLARVLHDWGDEQATKILNNAANALTKNGRIYIIEMIISDSINSGHLLDLNMLVMTGGKERTLHDWKQLISNVDLTISAIKNISPIINIIEVEKRP